MSSVLCTAFDSNDHVRLESARRGGDEGGVAGKQLGAAEEHQEQAKGQAKRAVHHLLQPRVAAGQARAGAACHAHHSFKRLSLEGQDVEGTQLALVVRFC